MVSTPPREEAPAGRDAASSRSGSAKEVGVVAAGGGRVLAIGEGRGGADGRRRCRAKEAQGGAGGRGGWAEVMRDERGAGQKKLAPPLGSWCDNVRVGNGVRGWCLGFYTWYERVIFFNSRGKVGTPTLQTVGSYPRPTFCFRLLYIKNGYKLFQKQSLKTARLE